MRHSTLILTSALVVTTLGVVTPAWGADWIFGPSTYTHDPASGRRVTQYAVAAAAYIEPLPGYQKSGYRHFESTIRGRFSQDRMHIVEEWGRPVRPYGEWRHPYRPYSVPYQQWGPPYAGMYTWNGPFYGRPPHGHYPGHGPGAPGPGAPGGHPGGGHPGPGHGHP